MQRVCDIITNCCCESTGKLTKSVNTELETQLRNQLIHQYSHHNDNNQNTPTSVNDKGAWKNACECTEYTVQTANRSMRKIFTPKSQIHKEGTYGYNAINDVHYPTRTLEREIEREVELEQSPKMTGNETPDLPSQEYMNIAGYHTYGKTTQIHENSNRRIPMTDTRHYNIQQHMGYTDHQKTNKVYRSRFNPLNMCCACCCEGNVEPIQRSIFNDNNNNRTIILKPIRRERIVEVMVEEIQERVINVPQVQYVDKFVEVPKPIFQYKIREVKRPVIVEKIVKVDKIVEEEKIIEVPEIQYVDKEVDVPQIVKKERIVEVPLPIVRERRIPILKLKKNEIFQEIDNINYNEFGINLTSLRGEAMDAPSAPNNTPVKRNDTEDDVQGSMQAYQNGKEMYQTINDTENAEINGKLGALVALASNHNYNENGPATNKHVYRHKTNDPIKQGAQTERTYEQTIAETCLTIYGTANKSAERSLISEALKDENDTLTVTEVFTERETQNGNLHKTRTENKGNAKQTTVENSISSQYLQEEGYTDELEDTENYMKLLENETQHMIIRQDSNAHREDRSTDIYITNDVTQTDISMQMTNAKPTKHTKTTDDTTK